MRRCALLALLAITGCYAPLEDEADLFMVPPGVDALVWGVPPGEYDYLEGEPLVVHAFFNFSGKLKRPTCEIAVAGDTPTIQTSVKYRRRSDGALWHAQAVCQTGPLDAGTYTIVFDGRERTLTIPGTVEPPSFLIFEP
ncbi:hypothetical protein [Nannocystis pusilla]|uniref:Lipoprotein n=1 Tax=Nannocystis pusilla TaxID=889268 RepID=A0ABS7TI65_9BACT|nr:hypothetical protein [Nannocystis pusilla]MBZ5707910.1 hypothetical protein [Nannocystis pusilla]